MEKENGWNHSKERTLKLVFTLNLPRPVKAKRRADHNSHYHKEDEDSVMIMQNIYADIDVKSWDELLKLLHEHDYILAHEFYVRSTDYGKTRSVDPRGEIIINCQMIGKIKPYFE
jgi:hypothetical protein